MRFSKKTTSNVNNQFSHSLSLIFSKTTRTKWNCEFILSRQKIIVWFALFLHSRKMKLDFLIKEWTEENSLVPMHTKSARTKRRRQFFFFRNFLDVKRFNAILIYTSSFSCSELITQVAQFITDLFANAYPLKL